MGEMDKSVLRVGGWAGVLAGVLIVIGLITFFLSPTPITITADEQTLATFPEFRTLFAVGVDLTIVGSLLSLLFLAALYGSLREPSRVFARIGLGSGVLGLVLYIVGLVGFLLALDAFSGLHAGAAVSDRPVVVATYAAVATLLSAGLFGGFLLIALAFVAFGLAMRGSPDFGGGLAWLSVVLGILAGLLLLIPAGIFALLVFVLVFGWKVYSLSRAA